MKIWADTISTTDAGSSGDAFVELYGTFLPGTPGGNGYVASPYEYCSYPSTEFITSLGTVQIEPGVTYTVHTNDNYIDSGTLYVVPPPGYSVVINGMYTKATPYGTTTFSVVPTFEGPPGAAGFASSISGTEVNWRLSLGFLRNGNDAGNLQLADPATEPDLSPLFTPSALSYSATSSEVYVYSQNGTLRQIIANQVAIDIVTLSPSSYEIRCYNPAQIQGYVPCTFSGSPFVVYRVEKGTPDSNHTNDPTAVVFKFTRETRNVPDAFATDLPIARRDVMTLQRSGSWPSFQWIKTDWTQDGQTPAVQVTTQGAGTVQNRTEAITVAAPGSPAAATLTRNYTLASTCGETLTGETLGSANPRTTQFSYFTSTAYPGALGYVSTVNLPGGGWRKFDYDSSGTNPDSGNLLYIYSPYVSSPSTPTSDSSQVEYTYYHYQQDPFGYDGRLGYTQTVTPQGVLSYTTFSYDDTDAGANDGIVAVTRTDGILFKVSNVTNLRYYTEDTYEEYKRGQPVSIGLPSGVLKTYTYEVGSWDGTTFTPSSYNLWITGSRITETIGIASSNGALTLVDGRSVENVTIRDIRALPVRTESYVWHSNAWQLTSWTNFTYSFAGLLTGTISSNGATTSTVWDGQLKASDSDQAGITTSYAYDAAGRLSSTTRAACGSVPALTTAFTYDALGNQTRETLGAAGGEQLISSKTFDDATRPASETPAGLGTTTWSYDVANRASTKTMPDGGTITDTSALDGRLVSRTGSAIVAEFYSYGTARPSAAPWGVEWTQVNSGSAGSPRWKKSWIDVLGRNVETDHPGFGTDSQSVDQRFFNSSTSSSIGGFLYKTTRTGLAATLYQYDAFGLLNRSGLDLNGNGTLDLLSNDRIADQNATFEFYNNAWWERTDRIAYRTANSSSPTTISTVRKRLSGFPANRLAETQMTDVQGNVTTITKDIDRSTGLVTETTTRTGQTWTEKKVYANGLLVSQTGRDGLTTTIAYDSLMRKSSVTDSRGNATTYACYPGSTLLHTVADATGAVIGTYAYDSMGRKISSVDAAGHTTRFSYDLHGRLIHEWGDGTFPVEYAYDPTYGDRISMSTFRGGTGWDGATWPSGPGTADTTTWAYDPATGLLASKTDASDHSVAYAYDSAGRLQTRTWARGVTTTYTFDPGTGDQTAIQYSDGTPNLGYVYNRVGESSQVTQTGNTTIVDSFDRCVCGKIDADHLDASFFGGRIITYKLNPNADGTKGRTLGYTLSSGGTVEQNIDYTYDPATDRFSTLLTSTADAPASARTFRYSYLDASDLISGMSVDASPFAVNRSFEPKRDVLTSIAGQWDTTTETRYDYVVNALGQRTSVVESGAAFSNYGNPIFQLFSFDARGELTSALGYLGGDITQTARPMQGRQFTYSFDTIGNRTSTNRTAGGTAENYTTNSVNQYVTRENHSVQVSGTADPSANVAVAGGTGAAQRQGRYWTDEVTVGNGTGPWRGPLIAYIGKSGAGPGGTDLLGIDSRVGEVGAATQSFSYDADGNLLSDGIWAYSWDAENRLIAMQRTGLAGFPDQRIEFRYDYLGRRIEKLVRANWNGTVFTTVALQRRYAYEGWNLVAEYSVDSSGALALVRTYTWGLDIAGSLTQAGGVGALLEIVDHASGKTYFPTYDGNGDVTSLVNADSGSLAATYEYSPFGEMLRAQANDASIADQPFRFSTKFWDGETGLYYYGMRFYDSRTGRFVGRDPAEENGGLNLYAFVLNAPIEKWDVLGEEPDQPPPPPKFEFDSSPVIVLPTFNVVADRVSNEDIAEQLRRIFTTRPSPSRFPRIFLDLDRPSLDNINKELIKMRRCAYFDDVLNNLERQIHKAINDYSSFKSAFEKAEGLALDQVVGDFVGLFAGAAVAGSKAYITAFKGVINAYSRSVGWRVPYAFLPGFVKVAASDAAFAAAKEAAGESAAGDIAKDASILFGKSLFSFLGILEPGNYYGEKIIDISNDSSQMLHDTISAMQGRYDAIKKEKEKEGCPG